MGLTLKRVDPLDEAVLTDILVNAKPLLCHDGENVFVAHLYATLYAKGRKGKKTFVVSDPSEYEISHELSSLKEVYVIEGHDDRELNEE